MSPSTFPNRGWDVAGVYSDLAGTSEDRSGLAALEIRVDYLEMDVDCVVVYGLSRIHRDRQELRKFEEMLGKHGVELVSVTEPVFPMVFSAVLRCGACEETRDEDGSDAVQGMEGPESLSKESERLMRSITAAMDGYFLGQLSDDAERTWEEGRRRLDE